jgi:RHS repeat-associated protein
LNTSANAPLFTQSYRMLADGNLADLHRVAAGWWDRDEFIYLQGMPVGVTHTDNSNPVPVSYWLSPDMMGTPRRILTRDATLTQVGRLVMDPWGAAVLLPDNSRNVGTGSIPARVWLPHRLPGQLQGQFEPFVDNQHRMYFPDARSYLSADPEHGSSAMTPGPQAYTYANGNPFKFVDPTGLIALPPGVDTMATVAAQEIVRRTNADPNGRRRREFGCYITGDKCSNPSKEDLHLENWSVGPVTPYGERAEVESNVPRGRKVWALIHSHPSGNPRLSTADANFLGNRVADSIYMVTWNRTPEPVGASTVTRWDWDTSGPYPNAQFMVPAP